MLSSRRDSGQSIEYAQLTHFAFSQRQLCSFAESYGPLTDRRKLPDVHPLAGILKLVVVLLHNVLVELLDNILHQQSSQLGTMIQHTYIHNLEGPHT